MIETYEHISMTSNYSTGQSWRTSAVMRVTERHNTTSREACVCRSLADLNQAAISVRGFADLVGLDLRLQPVTSSDDAFPNLCFITRIRLLCPESGAGRRIKYRNLMSRTSASHARAPFENPVLGLQSNATPLRGRPSASGLMQNACGWFFDDSSRIWLSAARLRSPFLERRQRQYESARCRKQRIRIGASRYFHQARRRRVMQIRHPCQLFYHLSAGLAISSCILCRNERSLCMHRDCSCSCLGIA